MIDPRKTGAYISQLRRAKDWTQLQMAEQLNVTHQAVSRWETGDSFPDLTLLAHLAQLFDVRVDDLLQGHAPVAPTVTNAAAHAIQPPQGIGDALAAGQPAEVADLVRADPQKMDAVIEAAPITPPSLMKGIMTEMQNFAFSQEQIGALAPFLDADTLRLLVEGLSQEEIEGNMLNQLAPFLDQPTLDALADRALQGEISMNQLTGLAPFLSQEALDRLAMHTGDGELPGYQLTALAPFLSQETLGVLLDRAITGEVDLRLLQSLAPFVDGNRLGELVEAHAGEHFGLSEINSLAPFLPQESLQRLLMRSAQGELDAQYLAALAPFVDSAFLGQLIRQRMGK